MIQFSSSTDLFILAAEPSADLHGADLARELLSQRGNLKISAVAGPKMRQLPISPLFSMEDLSVIGFIDVFFALPKIISQFFKIRNKILEINPKAVVCIDYPGFNLRLEQSLRKKGYKGKIIHYISPTVWIWGKKRIDILAKTADLLLTFFPFEKKYFDHTPLPVQYVGHPLTSKITFSSQCQREKILALFPGSREKEIERNFPIQLKAAKKLLELDPEIKIAVSISNLDKETQLKRLAKNTPLQFYPPEKNYELMKKSRLSLATSGTVTLELALHRTPTIVHYAVHPIDLFIVQKILSIHLPFYCIVNIIAQKGVFPELFGPNFTEEQLFFWAKKIWVNEASQREIKEGCEEVWNRLGKRNSGEEAARAVISLAF